MGWPSGLLIAALTVAGAIHLLLAPDHFEESTVMGIGFLGSALAEFALAAALLVTRKRVVYIGVVLVATTLIGLYVYNVMVGLPFGTASPTRNAPTDVGKHGGHAEDGSGHEAVGHHGAGLDANGHHHDGLALGEGEPVDALGVVTKVSEAAAIGLAITLLLRARRKRTTARN
jgi:hypothetical protein